MKKVIAAGLCAAAALSGCAGDTPASGTAGLCTIKAAYEAGYEQARRDARPRSKAYVKRCSEHGYSSSELLNIRLAYRSGFRDGQRVQRQRDREQQGLEGSTATAVHS